MKMTPDSLCTIDEEDNFDDEKRGYKCSAKTECAGNSDCPMDHQCAVY